VRVCSLRYPTRNAHTPYCHLWLVRLYNIFQHCPINGKIIGNIVYWTCVLVLSTNFSEAFLILRRPERDMIKNVYWFSCTVPVVRVFWCRIRLWFRWMGVCKQSRWRHSVTVPSKDGGYVLLWQRYDNNKMADMCYYGSVMTTTRWRICVTMATLFYIFNSTVIDWTCLFFFNETWTFLNRFSKNPQIKFRETPSRDSRIFPLGQTWRSQ